MNGATIMPQPPLAEGDRFTPINQLLEEYARLPNDPVTARAFDEDKERRVLDKLCKALKPLVQQCINELSWRVSRADHDVVRQTFWSLFIAYLRRERAAGRSVQITSLNFIRWKVKHAADFRGLQPLDQLDTAIHDYLSKPPDERNWHVARVLVALEHCCEKVRKANHAKGVSPIRTTEEVAQLLFDRFAEGTIWNLCITPTYAQRAEDLDSNEEDGGSQRIWNIPHYVADWGAFRTEAWPPLFGGSPPRPRGGTPTTTLSADQLMPEKHREKAKKLIEGQLSALEDARPPKRFKHLSCLLFLGYYKHQRMFCRDFDINAPYVVTCKGFWLEQVVEDLAAPLSEDENRQKELLRLYRNHKYYGELLDCLHEYWFIACAADAREALKANHAVAYDVLCHLWRCCFWGDNAGPSVGFQFRVARDELPESLVVFKRRYPSPEAVSVRREYS